MILSSQITTVILWLVIFYNCINPIDGYTTAINWTGLGLGIAHAIEAIVFLPKAKKAGGSLPAHIVMLLIFGYVHNMVLDKKLAAQ